MAVKLGYVNVDAMLRTITARQFTEWEAYARIEPFNELRADYRAALIAQTVFNMAVGTKNRKTLDDFLLKWKEDGEQPAKQTWQQQKAIAYMIATAYSVPGRDT